MTQTEKALDLFCFIMYRQLSWDGNKRTGPVAANKFLLSSGHGIMTIHDEDMEAFNERLEGVYQMGEGKELKTFLYQKAVFGIEV